MTEFFSKVGMLKPINERIDDYGYTWLTITQDECDELKKYASQYPKPISPVVYYLTAHSLEAFEKQLPVKGGVKCLAEAGKMQWYLKPIREKP